MKPSEIRAKKPEELEALQETLQKDLKVLRIQARMGELRETTKPGRVRREIARVLTIRKERETA